MPLEGFQLFCDRNDHFSLYDREQSCTCREPIHPATETENFVQNSVQGVFTFCNDDLIRFKGNHRM